MKVSISNKPFNFLVLNIFLVLTWKSTNWESQPKLYTQAILLHVNTEEVEEIKG